MELPNKGKAVTVAKLTELAIFFEKFDVVEMLKTAPDDVFISDGCSMWPDSWFGADLYPCCFWHDVRYWCGNPGDDVGRLFADAELAKDVAREGEPDLARLMFVGVGVGGTEKVGSPFRWGYGR